METTYTHQGDQFTLILAGDYLHVDNDTNNNDALNALQTTPAKTLNIHARDLKKWDSTLVIFLINILEECQKKQTEVNMSSLPNGLKCLINLSRTPNNKPPLSSLKIQDKLTQIGEWALSIQAAFFKGYNFIGKTFFSLGRFITGKATMRKVDFLFALENCGPKAILIVSLISFMVGLILAFVGAIQLQLFGAQVFVASLVAIGMTRIMAAIMVGIIMAGRTGASYAAAIGTMQVNEEVDALKTMGIPTTDFLVLPRFLALVITMPILTLLADAMGIIGGLSVGVFMLDIPVQEYWRYTEMALQLRHFWVGIFHGFMFGIIIALCGCYYGIYCGRDADSVGKATTQAVVSSIVWMIVATGIITWIFMQLGV